LKTDLAGVDWGANMFRRPVDEESAAAAVATKQHDATRPTTARIIEFFMWRIGIPRLFFKSLVLANLPNLT